MKRLHTATVVLTLLLDEYDLEGKDAAEIIDRLDRLGGDDRPADLMASVRPDELVLSADGEELTLPLPEDRFYLSVAPYVDETHDCFHHSLTTCTGELASTDVQVQVVDETNDRVLLDRARTTFENGFTGFWLPATSKAPCGSPMPAGRARSSSRRTRVRRPASPPSGWCEWASHPRCRRPTAGCRSPDA